MFRKPNWFADSPNVLTRFKNCVESLASSSVRRGEGDDIQDTDTSFECDFIRVEKKKNVSLFRDLVKKEGGECQETGSNWFGWKSEKGFAINIDGRNQSWF